MPRDYGTIRPAFWTGETGRAIRGDGDAQRVAAYLITGPLSNMIGLYQIALPILSYEIGIPLEGARKALRSLNAVPDGAFLHYDEPSEWLWVVNGAREQLMSMTLKAADKKVKGVERLFLLASKSPWAKGFWEYYHEGYHLPPLPEISTQLALPLSPIEGASKDHRRGCAQEQEQEHQQEQDQEQEHEQPARSDFKPMTVDEEAALHRAEDPPRCEDYEQDHYRTADVGPGYHDGVADVKTHTTVSGGAARPASPPASGDVSEPLPDDAGESAGRGPTIRESRTVGPDPPSEPSDWICSNCHFDATCTRPEKTGPNATCKHFAPPGYPDPPGEGVTSSAEADDHGTTCRKAPHKSSPEADYDAGYYGHDAGEDGPFEFDGATICGRCHRTLTKPDQQSVEDAPQTCGNCGSFSSCDRIAGDGSESVDAPGCEEWESSEDDPGGADAGNGTEDRAEVEPDQKPKRKRKPYSDAFERFWKVCHKRTNKGGAAKAFALAVGRIKVEIREGVTDPVDFLLERMTAFAKSDRAQTTDHTPVHVATWLNNNGFDDDDKAWERPNKDKGRVSQAGAYDPNASPGGFQSFDVGGDADV